MTPILKVCPILVNSSYCIVLEVSDGKKRKNRKSVFESIRKPTAPPSAKIGERRPDDKVHPSLRDTKHKKKEELND